MKLLISFIFAVVVVVLFCENLVDGQSGGNSFQCNPDGTPNPGGSQRCCGSLIIDLSTSSCCNSVIYNNVPSSNTRCCNNVATRGYINGALTATGNWRCNQGATDDEEHCPDRSAGGDIGTLSGNTIPRCDSSDRVGRTCWDARNNALRTDASITYYNSDGTVLEDVSRFGYMECGGNCRDILEDENHCSNCNRNCNSGDNVQNWCSSGLCACEDQCDYRTGFESRRYGRCHRQLDVIPERVLEELGYSFPARSWDVPDVDVWPPTVYENSQGDFDNARIVFDPLIPSGLTASTDGITRASDPYQIWNNFDGQIAGSAATWATRWGVFLDDWWDTCQIDFFRPRYQCPIVHRPQGIPFGSTTPRGFNVNRDPQLNEMCDFNCGANAGVERRLYKCSRFNPHFRNAVADLMAGVAGAQAVVDELCSAMVGVNVDYPNDDGGTLCCAYSFECAAHSGVCGSQRAARVATSSAPLAGTVVGLPCDKRSPVYPSLYLDRPACDFDEADPVPIQLNQIFPFNTGFGLNDNEIANELLGNAAWHTDFHLPEAGWPNTAFTTRAQAGLLESVAFYVWDPLTDPTFASGSVTVTYIPQSGGALPSIHIFNANEQSSGFNSCDGWEVFDDEDDLDSAVAATQSCAGGACSTDACVGPITDEALYIVFVSPLDRPSAGTFVLANC